MPTKRKDPQADPEGFKERLEECPHDLQKTVNYLQMTAQHASADVSVRPYVPKTGWGITYSRAGKWFCQVHPKRQARHVQAFIRGADPKALDAAGFSAARRKDKQPWVEITNMRDAVRLVPFILAAAGPDLNRRGGH